MQGVVAAVPTPIGANDEFLEDLFLEHCNWALDHGCDGLNILGSTGEASSFDTSTRKEIMDCAAKNLPRERLMVGTGSPSLAETIDLTRHASNCGYPVALVLPPYYYKPVSEDGLALWYRQVHESLGDSPLRLYFYNYPQMTGITLPVSLIETLHREAPNRFAGIKDSSGDLDYCRALTAAMPDLRVFPSSETSLERAHLDGYAGCISATVNVTCETSARVWRAAESADQSDIETLHRDRAILTSTPLIPTIKRHVAQRTNQQAWATPLPPFVTLDLES